MLRLYCDDFDSFMSSYTKQSLKGVMYFAATLIGKLEINSVADLAQVRFDIDQLIEVFEVSRLTFAVVER